MASDELSDLVDGVQEALEQRGARAIRVRGEDMDLFAVGKEQPQARTASIQVDYDGDPEMLENAAAEVDGVTLTSHQTEAYPGGDVHVSGDLGVVNTLSPGANPGGNTGKTAPQHPNCRSSTTPVDAPSVDQEVDQDPHVPGGGTWAIRDENGIADQYEVEAWPVRMWEPRPDVPAVSMLRYIPDPAAEGLDWWGGYVLLAPVDLVGSAGLYGHMKERLRETRVEYEGVDVPLSYHDDEGWVGWSAADLPTQMAGIPVYSTVDTEFAHMDHMEAADITERLAQAALDIRREVL